MLFSSFIFKHFKGKNYLKIGLININSKPHVLYKCLYENELCLYWARPQLDFEGVITIDNKKIPRFQKLMLIKKDELLFPIKAINTEDMSMLVIEESDISSE